VARILAQPVDDAESAWHKTTSASWMYFHCSDGQHIGNLYEQAILLSITPGQTKKFPERLVQLASTFCDSDTANLYLANARINLPNVVARFGVGHLIVPDLVRVGTGFSKWSGPTGAGASSLAREAASIPLAAMALVV